MRTTELKSGPTASLDIDGYSAKKVYRIAAEGGEILKTDEVLFQWPRSIGYTHPIFSNIAITDISSEMEDTSVLVTEEYGLTEQTAQENSFGEEWVWDLGAQMTRITAVTAPSKQTHYPPTADVGTVIGWDGERVEGVSVYRPTQTLTVTKHFEEKDLDSKIKAAHLLQLKTNFGGWKFYKEGEVLFVGAKIRKNAPDDWVIDYSFMIARQQADFPVTLIDGTVVNVLTLGPWDYGWGLNTQKTVNGKTTNGIESFHVAEVYEQGNLSELGLKGPTG